MKILFICEEYPPGRNGGIGTMVQTLGRELVRQSHEVYVVGLYPHAYGGLDFEEDQGVKVWRLRYRTDIGLIGNNFSRKDQWLWRLLKFSSLLQWDTYFSVKRLFRFIRKLVDKEKIDVIEMSDWNTFFQHSFLTIKTPSFEVPLIVKFNGSYSYFQREMGLPLKRYVYRSEYYQMHRADALCSVSRYTAAKTALLFRLHNPIEILYNSINIPLQNPAKAREKKIIFTGTLIRKKGIYSLVKAWNVVSKKHPDMALDIYGKGHVHELTALLEPTVTSTVHFHGHVSREKLFEELSSAIAAVFPSYAECFAFAPLEAMAVGCPVINSSRSSGPELITDQKNGLLIDPDDVEGLSRAILLMLENEDLRHQMALEGRRTIEMHFDVRDSVKQHVIFYQRISDQFKSDKKTKINQT
ncbi:MAG TPA: glycosyltransferase family 4 protein [Puia sp.]|nr:glycosyltransferase family 4 protein [Puia sp.]